MSERIEKLKGRINDVFYCLHEADRKHDDENTKKEIYAILSEYDKPVEGGEYRVDSINGSAVVLLGDECVLDITGAEPFQGSAIAHKVVGLLGTLSTRVQELEGDLSTMEAHRDEWRLRARDFTTKNSKLKERVQELETDNQMHRLVARDSGHEQTNSYNTIQSLNDENSKFKERIGELEEQITVFSGLKDGSCPELIEWFENNLCNVESPSDDVIDKYWPMLCHLEDSHIRLTAEVETQKAEVERLREAVRPVIKFLVGVEAKDHSEKSRYAIEHNRTHFVGLSPIRARELREPLSQALAPASPQGEETVCPSCSDQKGESDETN